MARFGSGRFQHRIAKLPLRLLHNLLTLTLHQRPQISPLLPDLEARILSGGKACDHTCVYVMGTMLVCTVVFTTLRALEHVSEQIVAQIPMIAFRSNFQLWE